ncbi:MAG: ABC transporter ATPase [Oscillibacter sp.]|nr:ABC transporter ATPase [Oscillibacter sp.]
MKELQTIQQENKLNDVFAVDEPGPGGAHHHYAVFKHGDVTPEELPKRLEKDDLFYNGEIHFQKGPRNDPASTPGVLDTDLLEIVRDRLKDFQNGPFACHENVVALNHVSAALNNLNARTQDRAKRGVLGTNNL